MPQRTKIEWADYSSNPFINLATAVLVEKEIQHMLSFRPKGPFKSGERPKVSVGYMTDLFGEWVPFELLDRLFAVFALRSDVDWLLLTKRPERMAEYLRLRTTSDGRPFDNIEEAADELTGWSRNCEHQWPLPSVWLGTSVEDQATADARIPHLLKCPAAVRYVSYEPALGGVDFDPIGCEFCESSEEMVLVRDEHGSVYWCQEHEHECGSYRGWLDPDGIDWIITGGESGHGARPCNVEWIRSVVQQCKQAGVACFVKQLGKTWHMDFDTWTETLAYLNDDAEYVGDDLVIVQPYSKKGSDPSEWPADINVHQWPVIGGDA